MQPHEAIKEAEAYLLDRTTRIAAWREARTVIPAIRRKLEKEAHRTVAERSPSCFPVNFSYSTRGTSTWMSMRSSSEPEKRFW